MKTLLPKACRTILFLLAILTLSYGSSSAIPSAGLTSLETDLGGGMWRYDYTVHNTSDPVIDSDYDLFRAFIGFDPPAIPLFTAVPSGWDLVSGCGFFDAFSLNPGSPPMGSDVAPGTSLSGFSFATDYRLGEMNFDAYLFNPNDPHPNPLTFSGSISSPVPEPVTGLLLGTGLAGLAWARKRSSKKRNSGQGGLR